MTILQIAMGEVGIKEFPEEQSNPRILEYAEEAEFPDYHSDDIAWCSLFMNWVAKKSGMERSKDLAARSWLNIGIPIQIPEPGDIVIFWRDSLDSWKGHVGIFMGYSSDSSRIYCLGGNQGDQVSVTAYSSESVLGFRRLRSNKVVRLPNEQLKLGSSGSKVVILQEALKQLGYSVGTSDGIFGPKTENALKAFQSSDNSLVINGVFDKETREKLSSILNLSE